MTGFVVVRQERVVGGGGREERRMKVIIKAGGGGGEGLDDVMVVVSEKGKESGVKGRSAAGVEVNTVRRSFKRQHNFVFQCSLALLSSLTFREENNSEKYGISLGFCKGQSEEYNYIL